MAAKEPYGNTPLTTQDLANLGHPLSASDFNQDAQGRLWRVIRGQKTYYAPEWFDQNGVLTGTGTQPGDKAGQDQGFFHQGQKWNWTTGQWENPTNWANVIGLSAAGAVAAGIAAPYIAGALGGGAGSGGGSAVSALGDVGSELGTGAATTAAEAGSVLPSTALPAGLGSTLPAGSFGGGAGITATLAEPGIVATGTGIPSVLGTPAGVAPSGAVPTALTSTSAPGFFSWPGAGGLVKGATGGGGVTSIWDLVVPGINAGLNLYGQNKQANAVQDAASQQFASTKYATDAQSKSNADMLAYLQGQAGYQNTVAEVNRQANYEQWAAKQKQLGSVGEMLGLPARAIPAYVPLPTNTASAPVGTTVPATTAPAAGGVPASVVPPDAVFAGGGTKAAGQPNIQGGDIRSQVADYFKARGVTPNPTSVDYWASKWNEFGSKDPGYFNMRLANADEFGGGGGTAPAPAAAMTTRWQPLTVDPSLFATVPAGTLRPYAGPVGSYLV